MLCKRNNNYGKFEAIIFDIDGVLIDVINSYNQTIIETIQHILKINFDMDLTDFPIRELISKFRYTGGFNNDIDTTYSIILSILYCKLIQNNDLKEIFKFFFSLIEKIDDRGIHAVEDELKKLGNIEEIKNKLGYPKENNIISTVFNEIFYGPDLFRKQFNKNPQYYFNKPLIGNDRLIIKKETIQEISREFNGKLILISGRSKIAAYFTLNNIIDYFIKDACVFLEDEKREYSKPNTYAIHRVFDHLKLKNAIYVGDSIEDILMVKKFRQETNSSKIIFCGVYGKNTNSSLELKKLFESNGADILVENVNEIPNILYNIKKKNLHWIG
ncbi:MAG: HAD family hydrolase [Candidatus Nitrosocosmicus sp.]